MAKMYGNRYENLNRQISGGGQGDILRVRDTLDSSGAEYALKRLRNNDRCARFKLEIEALQKIDHPNVIKIIDHAGDPQPGERDHKYWFVMPIASGNLEDRIGLYRGDLDAVLRVAIQLADALNAAHKLKIVHRDVKPANILFPRMDHHVWLSDFGICHIATTKERLTPADEVMGPRGFIAPELEGGGQVPISGAADVYSLGKVIYYMLSGGLKVAREQLNSPEYLAAFSRGERFGLLRTLLARMIAPLDRRIESAEQVRGELEYIARWEQTAHSMALDASAIAAIEAAKTSSSERQQIRTENASVREAEESLIRGTAENIAVWLRAELVKTAALLTQGGTYRANVEPLEWKANHNFVAPLGLHGSRGAYIGVDGIQLSFVDTAATLMSKFVLKFFVTSKSQVRFQSGNAERPRKPVDPEMAVIPYLTELQPPEHKRWGVGGFIKSELGFARIQGQGRAGNTTHGRIYLTQTFTPELDLVAIFKASEWPAAIESVKKVFSEAIKTALVHSRSDIRGADN